MSMRVIECNICGEPLSAENDDELVQRLLAHVEAEHESAGYDEEQARDTVEAEAYEASDN
jgi:predicted small metal-binding protein